MEKEPNLKILNKDIDWENMTDDEFRKVDLELRMVDDAKRQKEWSKNHMFDYAPETVPLDDD